MNYDVVKTAKTTEETALAGDELIESIAQQW
jgi:hypothetical protein